MSKTNILYENCYHLPIGPVIIQANEHAITGIRTVNVADEYQTNATIVTKETILIKRAYEELKEYFTGERRTFDLPLYAEGTMFQMQVWKALQEIPYGETRSYKEIAEKTGRPAACRAVGGACHRNPIFIMIPCHRVIGSNGSMTGFGGGIPVKEQLLKLEKTHMIF